MVRYVEYDDEREKIRIGFRRVEYVMTVDEAKQLWQWLGFAVAAAGKKKHGLPLGKTFFGSYEQK